MVAFFVALVGVWGLVGGDDIHASQAEKIRSQGARVTTAPVVSVRNLENTGGRTDSEFSSTVTVLLKSDAPGGEKTAVSLETRTHEEPHQGGGLRVMYAPSDLSLGAVHGDAATLKRLMAGRAMTADLNWGLSLTMVGIAVILMAMSFANGVFTRIKRFDGEHRAIRGVCVGVQSVPSPTSSTRNDDCVALRCEGGANLHFWPDSNTPAMVEAIGKESVWACWRTVTQIAQKRGSRSAGVLIGDSGWALHGEFLTDEIGKLEAFGAHVVGSVDAPVDAGRRVGLWSPVTSWPLIVPTRSLMCVVVALLGLVGCLSSFSVQWRWTLGVLVDVALLAAVAMHVGPATKHVAGSVGGTQAERLNAGVDS